MRIYVTSIVVDDQAQALDFYTKKLGFEVKNDVLVGEHRWLTVVSTVPRLLLLFILSGCTALPLDPVSNHHLLSVGQVGFEKDKEICRQEAIDEGHDTKLKPFDIFLPFLLASGGAVFGLQAEYGSPLHPDEHPYYGGKVLFGLAIGGFVVGSALSVVGVLSRKRAQEAFIHDCLRGRGYEFSE